MKKMNFESEYADRLTDLNDLLKQTGFDLNVAMNKGVKIFFKVNKSDPLPIVEIEPNICVSNDELLANILEGTCEILGKSSIFGKIKLDKIANYKNNQILVTVRMK